jgi:hypothetical protein
MEHSYIILITFMLRRVNPFLTLSAAATVTIRTSNNNNNNNNNNNLRIIIIIIINCMWGLSRWQWIVYMYTIYNIATKFTSGVLHEKHVVATWNLGNHLSICF